MIRRFAAVVAAVILSTVVTATQAEEKPLWEVGAGIGVVSFPDYRGSDEQSVHAFPVPYFVYRGEFLKADRDGVRGVFFENENVELNLSLAASIPVDSDGNDARRGMPDIKPTIEVGPSLDFTMWRSHDRRAKFDLRLPVRVAYTVVGPVRPVGVVFTPFFNIDVEDPFGHTGWNLGTLVGPVFGNRRQHDYFYSVDPRYATPERQTYKASGGYGGTQFIAALSKRFERYWVGSFVRYDTLRGAVFDDSPLVRSDHAWAAGVAISWIIGESSERVQDDR